MMMMMATTTMIIITTELLFVSLTVAPVETIPGLFVSKRASITSTGRPIMDR